MYIPYLMTVVIYIGIANIFGVFGFVPPTKDLNCTIGLAITSIFLIEYAGFHKKGLKGFLKASQSRHRLCCRLIFWRSLFDRHHFVCDFFGNVLGSYVVMKLLEFICPAVLPIPFSLYFDFFDGFIQAYVFVFLTSLFIKEAIE